MYKNYITSALLVFFLSVSSALYSQNVAINSTGAPASPSAMLDVSSSTGGLLPPRMTTAQMNAINSPAEGLQVFDTTTHCLMLYSGNSWQSIFCACTGAPATPGAITGSGAVCSGASGVAYSIAAVGGANSYTWNVPAGASITAGQGTPSIIVTFGSASGNVSVTATNNCGTSAANTLAVTVNPLPTITSTTPGSRTGTGTVTLGATASAGTINWWAAATGGSSLATGTSFTTPAICTASATTYYADATANGCTTATRTSVTATVTKAFQIDNACSLTTGLVSYWEMEGNSNDFYGSNNGTDNAISYGIPYGKVNQGANFNGTSSVITMSAYPTSGTGNFSIFAWVKTSSTGTRKGIIAWGGVNADNGLMLFVNPSNQLEFDLCDIAGPNGTKTITDGNWHFVGMTNTAGMIQLYTDGVTDGSPGSMSPNITSGYQKTIGMDFNLTHYFLGDIDEVGVWSKVLSAQEITDLYNGGAGQTMQ